MHRGRRGAAGVHCGDVPLRLSLVGELSGLSRAERSDLQREVGDALTDYVVRAFLGDFPRDDFVEALGPFTSGAARRAAGDLDVLTARGYRDADDVAATRLVARVSVFTARGEAAGATARVRLGFRADVAGGPPTEFSVRGRLAMVPDGGAWRVFAYRLGQDPAPPGGAS